MNYEIFLFDADNTLFDFDKSEKSAFLETAIKFGIPANDFTYETYSKINDDFWKLHEKGEIDKKTLVVMRYKTLLDTLGVSGIDASVVNEYYTDALGKYNFLISGAKEVVEYFYAQGKRLFIITNGLKKPQTARFSTCEIKNYIENIFISDVIGFQKPTKEYFDYVERHIPNFDKSKTLVIGDSISSDIKGAVDYGLDACWYNRKRDVKPLNLDIKYEITDVKELITLFSTKV